MDVKNFVKGAIAGAWDTSKVGTIGVGAGLAGMGVTGAGMYHAGNATGITEFLKPGILANLGFSPESVNAAGQTNFRGYGMDLRTSAPYYNMTSETIAAEAAHGRWSWGRLKTQTPGNPLGLLGTAYFTYQGYQENGISGAYDAFALNAAMEASIYKWGYGVGAARNAQGWLNPATKLAGHPLKLGTSAGIFRGLGAGIGGYMGQQIGLATGLPMGGTFGAAAGAYIGGAPMGAFMENPILVGGLLTGVAAGALGYGAYSVIKSIGQAGYAHRQGLKGVNTDGDMSSFMTQNAMTMRSRAVQSIARSGINARSALGQEANFMHSPRNYNSSYR